jgi:hypothetical protein
MISGRPLFVVLIVLSLWFLFLCWAVWKVLKTRGASGWPGYSTIAAMLCSTVAVGSLMALHISWTSANLSQHLGVEAVRLLALFLFWPTVAGLVLSIGGSGRIRFLSLVSCLATGLWWLTLATGAGISMGAPIARHPTRFLIPKGYIGWVEIEYGGHAPPLAMANGTYICQFPESGSVVTSSLLEEGWAKDEYFYYSGDGSIEGLPNTGWGGGGMIWSGSTGHDSSKPGLFIERFYVGKEDQYRRNETNRTAQPSNEAKHY